MIQQSIWPVIAAAVSAVAIGYVWYHPRVFGTMWMRQSGMTPEMAERSAKHVHLYAVGGFVAACVAAFVIRMLMDGLGIVGVRDALRLGLWLFIGFAAPILLGSILWEHRSISLYLINVGYWLFALPVMCIILTI